MRHLIIAASLAAALAGSALAEVPGNSVKIGVLSDFSGPFADQAGKGSFIAAQMAAEDFARESKGLKAEIIFADHQNKPDVGSAIARRWVDQENVVAIVDLPNSGVALAVNTVMKEKNRTMLASGSATSDLTGKFCQPTTVQWALDTWALGNAMGSAITERGGKSWFFVSFDYALGKALQRLAECVIEADKEPGLAAAFGDRAAHGIAQRPGIERPLHRGRLAELSGQVRSRRARRQHGPVLLLHHRVDRQRHTGIRQVDDGHDVLLVDPAPRNRRTDVGLVLVIGE